MQLGVITEIITHFVGLLHVAPDAERNGAHPDGAPYGRGPGYAPTPHGHSHGPLPQLDPAATRPLLDAVQQGEPDGHFARWIVKAHSVAQKGHHDPVPIKPYEMPPPAPMAGGAGGDGLADDSGVHVRWLGPDQAVIDDHQVNMLIGDTSYVDHVAGALPIPADVQLESLIQTAYAVVPAGVPSLGTSASQELTIVKSFEDGLASGTTPAAGTLTVGTFVDGAATSADGTPIAPSLPVTTFDFDTPTATNIAQAQAIVLGHDTAANAALIVDTSAAPLTMIVEGNAYSANIIVQANVVQNIDQVAVSGAPDLGAIFDANSIHNTATFAELPYVVSGTATGSLAQTYAVTVVNGDLYDVNTVTQQNVLYNDSLYVGTPKTDHYYAVLGTDGQENALYVTHDGPSYDVLIVRGSSYQVNEILQENVLSSNNTIGVAFNPDNGASDMLKAGGNTISNQASIEVIGAQGWQPTTPDLQAFVQSLMASGEASGALPALPSYGSDVTVTVVEGNYYQLNLISQTNVVANSTSALADLTKAGAGTPGTVLAGVDTLSNAATIVSAHALDTQYVSGQQYSMSMLVQTNIVDAHATTSGASPAALSPDLVPFLDSANVSDVGTLPPSAHQGAIHDTTGHSVLA